MILNNPACRILCTDSSEGKLALSHPKDLTQILFLRRRGVFTWRGRGQEVPSHSVFIGTGILFCPDDGQGRYPLGIFLPTEAQFISQDEVHITSGWTDPHLFEPHYVVFKSNPLTAWFERVPQPERRETLLEL